MREMRQGSDSRFSQIARFTFINADRIPTLSIFQISEMRAARRARRTGDGMNKKEKVNSVSRAPGRTQHSLKTSCFSVFPSKLLAEHSYVTITRLSRSFNTFLLLPRSGKLGARCGRQQTFTQHFTFNDVLEYLVHINNRLHNKKRIG